MSNRVKKLMTGLFVACFAAAVIIGTIHIAVIYYYHTAIITAEPNTDEWKLSNDMYSLKVIDYDGGISFSVYLEDKLVYRCKESWRKRDLHSINITADNDILVKSGDVGTSTYRFKDGDWVCADKEYIQ